MTQRSTATDSRYDRRTVLKAGVAAATTAAVGAGTTTASESAAEDLTAWLENVGNFDGVVDERGTDEVTVEVGVEGNNGPYAFGPAAIRVDPGTTVVWEWTGDGSHNVVADDGAYESDLVKDADATFKQTFDDGGVSKYYCTPHKGMGMKGAVVVGDVEVDVPATGSGDASEESAGSDDSGDTDGSADAVDYDGWFEGVSNFDGTVDRTGEDEVTVEVGVEGNNGPYAFGPAAVRVDPGTTVVWEWTGDGSHNVVADDGTYESDLVKDADATFERTFDEEGVSKYYCTPHKGMGMKGAVVVGSGSTASVDSGAGGANGEEGAGSDSDLWLLGLVGGLVTVLFTPFVYMFATDDGESDDQSQHRSQHP